MYASVRRIPSAILARHASSSLAKADLAAQLQRDGRQSLSRVPRHLLANIVRANECQMPNATVLCECSGSLGLAADGNLNHIRVVSARFEA